MQYAKFTNTPHSFGTAARRSSISVSLALPATFPRRRVAIYIVKSLPEPSPTCVGTQLHFVVLAFFSVKCFCSKVTRRPLLCSFLHSATILSDSEVVAHVRYSVRFARVRCVARFVNNLRRCSVISKQFALLLTTCDCATLAKSSLVLFTMIRLTFRFYRLWHVPCQVADLILWSYQLDKHVVYIHTSVVVHDMFI